MKKFSLLLFCSAMLFSAKAQLTGTKNIPGDYADLATAISTLNASGVGSGGVVLNVLTGNTQTVSGTALQITATGTSANRIRIQGNGNSIVYTGTAGTLDGVFVLSGSDYTTIDNFVITVTDASTEWGVALLTPTANNGCRYDSVINMNITLNKTNLASFGIYSAHHTPAAATALTVTNVSGANSFNKYINNQIQNVYSGYSFTGYSHATPFDLYDQQNEIGKTVNFVSTISNYGGGASQAQGVTATNQNKIKIYGTNINSAGGANNTGILYGINLITGTNSDVDIYSDTISLTSAASGSVMIGLNSSMGNTGAGNTVNIHDNLVQNCSYTVASSAEYRGISTTATASYTNIYNNTITNNTLNTSGQISPLFYNGSSVTLVLKVDIYNNTITNNYRTTGVTAGVFNCLYASASTVLTQTHDNIINNNGNSTVSNGITYGYYNFGVGVTEMVYNNQISNLTGGVVLTLGIYAGSGTGTTNKAVYNNQVYNITGADITGGITCDYAKDGSVYKNNIYNISGTGVTGSPNAFGINLSNNNNLNVSVYNNFISELKAPNSASATAIYGIWAQGTTSSLFNIYNNSVYLNATSASATTFGSAAVFLSSTPVDIKLRNNILVNMSTPGPTAGASTAIVKSSASLTNYNILSSYNCLYAGVPAANRLIYSDGTNTDQTLANFINRVNPREHSSFSELPPFLNVGASPYNLHINPASATQCESGGTPVALIATDYDGQPRFNNGGYPTGTFVTKASDVGADEFGGNAMTDIAAPRIDYSLLGNDVVSISRSQTSFAVITDPSGVNTAGGTKPRIYYKKSGNTNTFNDNTNGTDGWKYAEASNSSSPFSFTIDYTLLQGGTVTAGDIIQYFVIAQDLATPNVSMNAGGFTLNPTSVNLAAANFPINGTINQYTITANSFAGTINVGSAETITSLTNAGGLFQQLNSSVLSGDLTVVITSDLSAETGAVALNQFNERGAGNYRISIVPDGIVTRTISGTSAGTALLRLDGADRVTFDGRFGGAGNYLRVRNLDNSAPGILILNDAQNNIIRNCIIESGNTTAATQNTGGAIQIGSSNVVNGNGNDNNVITYNEIRDRSDITATPNIGIIALGSTGTLNLYNDNNVISNNNIHDFFSATTTTQTAIHIGTGNSRFNIDSNSIYQTAVRTYTGTGATTRGINITQISQSDNYGGFNIRYNNIGGTSPGGGTNGNYWTMTSSGAIVNNFNAMSITTGLLPTVISNNLIKNIDFTSVAPTTAASHFAGIVTISGIFDINNNQMGAPTGNDSIKVTINLSSGTNAASFTSGIFANNSTSSGNTVTNNKLGGITIAGTTSSALFAQIIQIQGTQALPVIATGNLVGSTTTPNSIRVTPSANTQTGIFALRSSVTTGAPVTVSNNIIQNITDNSSNINSQDIAIGISNAVGVSVSPTVTNNIIKEIASNTGVAAATLLLHGIQVLGYEGNSINISGNTISGLRCTNTAAVNPYPVAIYVSGNSSGGTISKNKAFDFTNAGTGSAIGIYGIYTSAGSDWTVSNNMVAFNNGANNTNTGLFGIVDASIGGSYKAFYNSVHIGGTGSGAGTQNSYGFIRYNNAATSFRNNLIVTDRSNGTGISYAIANDNTTPTDGWSAGSSSYNTFITPSANVASWNSVAQSFAAWKTISGGDIESYADLNANASVTNLFTDAGNGDLTIKTSNPESWYVNNKAIAGTTSNSIASDFTGDIRNTILGMPTDIGADEFTPNAGVLPPDAVASAAPAVSTTTTYSFAGRKLGEITWGPGGTVPTAISWKYYSGIQPLAGAINTYHDVPATGGSGYTYDFRQYYTLAEQNQLSDAGLTGIKKTGASPWTGIGGIQSTDANGKFVTSTGLTGFSQFSLAQAGVVALRGLEFAGIRSNGVNHLYWKTENELNTKDFLLERSSDSRQFNGIATINARGYGNADYAYDDMANPKGKNYYRLKIRDINGRITYSNIVVLSDNKNEGILIYPNPVHDITTLEITDAALLNTQANILDVKGRKLQTIQFRAKVQKINMSGFAPGIYFLQLADNSVLKIIRN